MNRVIRGVSAYWTKSPPSGHTGKTGKGEHVPKPAYLCDELWNLDVVFCWRMEQFILMIRCLKLIFVDTSFLPILATPPWRWRQHGPLKRWYPTTTLHGVTIYKTLTWLIFLVRNQTRTSGCDRKRRRLRDIVVQSWLKITPVTPSLESHTSSLLHQYDSGVGS
jgi:hypothetical protein